MGVSDRRLHALLAQEAKIASDFFFNNQGNFCVCGLCQRSEDARREGWASLRETPVGQRCFSMSRHLRQQGRSHMKHRQRSPSASRFSHALYAQANVETSRSAQTDSGAMP